MPRSVDELIKEFEGKDIPPSLTVREKLETGLPLSGEEILELEGKAPESFLKDLLAETLVDWPTMLAGGAALGALGLGAKGALAGAHKYGALGIERPIGRAIKALGQIGRGAPGRMFISPPVQAARPFGETALTRYIPPGFTHRSSPEIIDISEVPQRAYEAITGIPLEYPGLPRFAGPTTPPIRLRDPSSTMVERAQAVIEDLLRESLKAKGLIQ